MTYHPINSVSKEYILYRMIRTTDWYKQRKKKTQNELSFPKLAHGAGEFCNKEKEIAEYQELGEFSKPQIYENLT